MKKILGVFLSLLLAALSMATGTVSAKTVVSRPAHVKVTVDNYYAYWDAHRSELKKAGYSEGDGNDAFISWSAVPGAAGYQVKMKWNVEGMYIETSKVNVTKNGGKYVFAAKGKTSNAHWIASSTKNAITKGPKTKMQSKKLAFYVSAAGSSVEIKKVQVRAYKIVNGKKVYGEYVSVNKFSKK